MIVDLIKQYELKEKNIKFEGISHQVYISYEGKILLLGMPWNKNDYTKCKTILNDNFVYAVECTIENIENNEIKEMINEKLEQCKVYEVDSETENQNMLYYLEKNGFCPLTSINDKKFWASQKDVLMYKKWKQEELEIVNVPHFKETLKEWLNLLIANKEMEELWKTENRYAKLKFLRNFNCLLLSEDEELRELYKKFYKTEEIMCNR